MAGFFARTVFAPPINNARDVLFIGDVHGDVDLADLSQLLSVYGVTC